MNEVNEGSTAILILTFKDENGDAVVPTSAIYRIDDVSSSTSILADTTFNPTSSVHELTITDEQNAMIRSGKSEMHEVTVEFDYSGDKKGTSSFFINVVNLAFIP